jgi:hypothetical protein
MPHPFFGAKDVCYIEKKVAKKKPFLARRACSSIPKEHRVEMKSPKEMNIFALSRGHAEGPVESAQRQ